MEMHKNMWITKTTLCKKFSHKTKSNLKIKSTEKCKNTKQTQFTPTLSTPATLHTKKAVPPNWTVVLCAIICNEKREQHENGLKN